MDPVLLGEVLSLLMFACVCALLLLGFPVAFTLGGTALFFFGIGYSLDLVRLADLGALPNRYFGVMTNYVLVAVPLFVFMGVMLERSRIAEALLETMGMLFGRLRGGLGISVVVVGMLLAASTGIVGATVITMGLLSLPVMVNNGYDKRLATGVIAASGTLGQVVPPSIVLVLLGDIMQGATQQARNNLMAQGIFDVVIPPINVLDLFAGALLPGLMLVGLYIAWILLKALLDPASVPPIEMKVDRQELRRRLLRVLAPPAILILAVLGSILAGAAPPTEAAAVGAVGAIMLAGISIAESEGRPAKPIYWAGIAVGIIVLARIFLDLNFQRREVAVSTYLSVALVVLAVAFLAYGLMIALLRTYRTGILTEVMRTSMQISAMVFVILLGASIFSLVFRSLGGEAIVNDVLSSMPGGKFGAVLTVMALMFFLGFFLDYIEIIFVVVPIVVPILLAMGVDPIWLGIMMSVNLQTSFLTPPFGFALFYLRGVAPASVSTLDIYRGIIPFVLIQLLGLALLWAFPGIATWLPSVIQ